MSDNFICNHMFNYVNRCNDFVYSTDIRFLKKKMWDIVKIQLRFDVKTGWFCF